MSVRGQRSSTAVFAACNKNLIEVGREEKLNGETTGAELHFKHRLLLNCREQRLLVIDPVCCSHVINIFSDKLL